MQQAAHPSMRRRPPIETLQRRAQKRYIPMLFHIQSCTPKVAYALILEPVTHQVQPLRVL